MDYKKIKVDETDSCNGCVFYGKNCSNAKLLKLGFTEEDAIACVAEQVIWKHKEQFNHKIKLSWDTIKRKQ